MKGKIHPKGVVATKSGPTITCNDPAKFHGPGKSSGKTPANGVEVGPVGGDTFTVNKPAIGQFPNADGKVRMVKTEKETTGKYSPEDTAADKTASQEGSGGTTDRPYPLKERYSK